MKTLLSSGFVILACILPFVMSQLPGVSTASSDTETDTPTTMLGPSAALVTSSDANEVEANSQEPNESGSTTEIPSNNSEAAVSNTEAEVQNTPPPNVENEMESDNIHNGTSNGSPHTTTTPPSNEDSTVAAETPLTTTLGTIEISVLTTQTITTTTGENLAETSPEVSEEPTTTASSVTSSTEQQTNVPSTTDAPQAVTESSTRSNIEVSTEDNAIPTLSEIPATTRVTETSSPSIIDKVNTVSSAQESTTETSSTTLSSGTTTMRDNTSEAKNLTESTEGSTEQVTTMTPETTKTSGGIAEATEDESSVGSCLSKADVNTILIIAIVVGVNVLSVIVTAICVHRLVSRRLSWDPPPMHYSKKKPAGGHPLAGPRTAGINLATDTDCRAGENPATQIPIVITNEDGWCVPYSDQDKKKKNSSDKNTEDTGV